MEQNRAIGRISPTIGKDYLLGIAIDNYEDRPLNNAKNDWHLFKNTLVNHYHFNDLSITELLDNSPQDRQPTKDNIMKHLQSYNKGNTALKKDDRLIIYFLLLTFGCCLKLDTLNSIYHLVTRRFNGGGIAYSPSPSLKRGVTRW